MVLITHKRNIQVTTIHNASKGNEGVLAPVSYFKASIPSWEAENDVTAHSRKLIYFCLASNFMSSFLSYYYVILQHLVADVNYVNLEVISNSPPALWTAVSWFLLFLNLTFLQDIQHTF